MSVYVPQLQIIHSLSFFCNCFPYNIQNKGLELTSCNKKYLYELNKLPLKITFIITVFALNVVFVNKKKIFS